MRPIAQHLDCHGQPTFVPRPFPWMGEVDVSRRSIVERIVLRMGARRLYGEMSRAERLALLYSTGAWERPRYRRPPPEISSGLREPGWGIWGGQEEPPGRWLYWLYCGGRGIGKSWRLTRFMLDRAQRFPRCRIALVARTAGTMVECIEGDSGILNHAPPWFTPEVQANKRQLVFPNKSKIRWFTAEEPENLRGPNNDFGAIEELCAQPKAEHVWKQLRMTMRKGLHPQIMIATTPAISNLLISIYGDKNTSVTIGNSYENRTNLAKSWLDENIAGLAGTGFWQQEVDGQVLLEAPGALFRREWFDRDTWCKESLRPSKYRRIGLGVDPARTSGEKADAWGIIKAAIREDGLIEILSDETINTTPDVAATNAVDLYRREPSASFLVADVGAGGKMVESLIRLVDKNVNVLSKSGTKGKRAWAEGASVLYGKHQIFHAPGLQKLENELCQWTDDVKWSPNRMDAMSYVVAELSKKTPTHESISGLGPERRRIL